VVWKVRADCTYTTAANKDARQAAVEALLPQHPAMYPSPITVGRFPGGVVSQSTVRFTVCYDAVDGDFAAAQAFSSALTTTIAAVARAQTLSSIHKA
jgi:hypothetical protein